MWGAVNSTNWIKRKKKTLTPHKCGGGGWVILLVLPAAMAPLLSSSFLSSSCWSSHTVSFLSCGCAHSHGSPPPSWSSWFHPRSTPQAVACEAGCGWCILLVSVKRSLVNEKKTWEKKKGRLGDHMSFGAVPHWLSPCHAPCEQGLAAVVVVSSHHRCQ